MGPQFEVDEKFMMRAIELARLGMGSEIGRAHV